MAKTIVKGENNSFRNIKLLRPMVYRFHIDEMLLTVDEWIIKQEFNDLRNSKPRLETKDEISINTGTAYDTDIRD